MVVTLFLFRITHPNHILLNQFESKSIFVINSISNCNYYFFSDEHRLEAIFNRIELNKRGFCFKKLNFMELVSFVVNFQK